MAELRSPKEILDLLLVSPNYNSVAVSVNEEDAFVKVFGLNSLDAWEEHGQGSGRFKTEIATAHLKFTDDDRRFKPLPGLVVFQLMEVKLLSPITLMVNNEPQFLHVAPSGDSGTLVLVSDTDPRAWVEISHDADSIYIASTSYEGNWKLDMIASMLLIVPADTDMPNQLEVTPPPHGKVPKEYTTMKPEFMKQSSVSRHAQRVNAGALLSSDPNPWSKNPPSLRMGDSLIEVDVFACSEDDLKKLRQEWFWNERDERYGKIKKDKISFKMALACQDDLIETAKAFIGVRVYAAEHNGVSYYLPIHGDDDMSLLCLLDRAVWKHAQVVYPSELDGWSNTQDVYLLQYGIREALLLQADILRERAASAEDKATKPAKTPQKRKPRSKGPQGGSGKVTSE